MNGKEYLVVYKEAVQFIQKAGVDDFREFKSVYVKPKIHHLKDVYRNLIEALLMKKRIREATGEMDSLINPLCEFNPKKTHANYKGDWAALQGVMEEQRQAPETYDALGAFCRGAIDGAQLLTQLGSIRVVNAFVESFNRCEMSLAALPLLLEKEVYGLTFQGACNFLDRIGYPDYVCLDPKVKVLLQGIGMIESRDNYEAFKTVLKIAKANQTPPENVHLIFFLIAIEKLPGQDLKGQLRQPFIDYIIPILGEL